MSRPGAPPAGTGRPPRGRAPALWLALLCAAAAAPAAEAPPAPGRFEIVAETVMPNLEENLRYARRERFRCLAADPLATAFPVLEHPSLAGCGLREAGHDGASRVYRLHCDGDRGTAGTARWRLSGPGRASGTLDVRLGGKNMTFTQRVRLRRTGGCGSP